jgi:hypothetical protein
MVRIGIRMKYLNLVAKHDWTLALKYDYESYYFYEESPLIETSTIYEHISKQVGIVKTLAYQKTMLMTTFAARELMKRTNRDV